MYSFVRLYCVIAFLAVLCPLGANAQTPTQNIDVFKQGEANFLIAETVDGLNFDDDKKKGHSVGKIIAFINEHRSKLVLGTHSEVEKLYFYPEVKRKSDEISQELIGRIHTDEISTVVRLQQTLYFYRGVDNLGNRIKIYVPYEGADIVAYIKDGKLKFLSSSLIIPYGQEQIDFMSNYNVKTLYLAKPEDNARLYLALNTPKFTNINIIDKLLSLIKISWETTHTDRDSRATKLNWQMSQILKKRNLIQFFIEDLIENYPNSIDLVMAKQNARSPYEFVYRIRFPYDIPVKIYIRAHPGVAAQMFEALAKESINIHMINTSEIKVSVIIDSKFADDGLRLMHDTFRLDE